MRPVNLIPPEDRRGELAPLRAGSLSYVIVGAIAAALVAVLALVLTQNSITDRENQIAQLEVTRDAAAQRATALAPYAEFASLQSQRELTITTLAESRFDWERVLRELALVIPGDITLLELEALTAGEAEGVAESSSDTGSTPSLTMSGCAPDHRGVAMFVAALEDIDGVTRVGLENSVTTNEAPGQSAGGGDGGCRPSDASFAVTAVFDGVAIASEPEAAPAVPAAPAATPTGETNSAQEQIDESKTATNIVPGAAR